MEQTIKSELNNLIELLPSYEADKVISYIKFLIHENKDKDDYIKFIESSPEKEEQISEETESNIRDSMNEIRNGEYYTSDQIYKMRKKR
jgi:hypothetical protein